MVGFKTRATFHPIKGKTKTNCDWPTHIFARFAAATRIYIDTFDWFSRLPVSFMIGQVWFWLYDTLVNVVAFSLTINRTK